MIQHLLNTTAIWLLCLLVYDIFLRKETFHKYNRIYLLCSLVLGIILPAINWQKDTIVYHTPLELPLQELVTVKQNIETTIVPAGDTFNSALIVLFVYLIGVLFSLVLIGKDVLLLTRLYRKGKRQKEDRWTVITTNEPHGPFSIFNYLFVSNRKLYDDREWKLLLLHEQQHASHLHFIDLVLMQLARVFFWFHPFVYIFQQRLLLIHEYQADAVGADKPAEYGVFLIEQAMLQANPAITHSFNRSPIKKRIIMLTKRSSKRNLLKALVALPLALSCIVFFSKTAYSFKKGGDNIVVFRGNTIEFQGPGQTGARLIKSADEKNEYTYEFAVKDGHKDGDPISMTFSPLPLKLNGDTIYSAGDVTKEPVFLGKDGSLSKYIFNNVKQDLGMLEDGEYAIHIFYPVVSKAGELVYYGNAGITPYGKMIINKSAKETINRKIDDVLNDAPKYKPAMVNSNVVNWYDAWGVELGYTVIVKNHIANLQFKEPR